MQVPDQLIASEVEQTLLSEPQLRRHQSQLTCPSLPNLLSFQNCTPIAISTTILVSKTTKIKDQPEPKPPVSIRSDNFTIQCCYHKFAGT